MTMKKYVLFYLFTLRHIFMFLDLINTIKLISNFNNFKLTYYRIIPCGVRISFNIKINLFNSSETIMKSLQKFKFKPVFP